MPGFDLGFYPDLDEINFEYYKTINFAKFSKWDKLIKFYSGEEADNHARTTLESFLQRFKIEQRFPRISNLLLSVQSRFQQLLNL